MAAAAAVAVGVVVGVGVAVAVAVGVVVVVGVIMDELDRLKLITAYLRWAREGLEADNKAMEASDLAKTVPRDYSPIPEPYDK